MKEVVIGFSDNNRNGNKHFINTNNNHPNLQSVSKQKQIWEEIERWNVLSSTPIIFVESGIYWFLQHDIKHKHT